jgi:hypothetical protein
MRDTELCVQWNGCLPEHGIRAFTFSFSNGYALNDLLFAASKSFILKFCGALKQASASFVHG